MKEKIFKWVGEALNVEDYFAVEYPADFTHGDYAINIAMVNAKSEGNNPRELAESYKEKLEEKLLPEIEKIEIAGPGFINIFLKKDFFSKTVGDILDKGEEYGKNKSLNGQKVMIEFTDPNPFKLFHIGHMMSNTIGESFARITEANGAEVKRACYQGDVGLHVAKALWGKMKKPELSWGEAYAYGSQEYEDNKDEIVSLNKKIYDAADEGVNKLYSEGKEVSLKYFEEQYLRLGMEPRENSRAFDFYFFESEAGPKGKELVLKFLEKGIFEKSDGAVVFKGEKRDPSLHTRVFISSEGLPVYEAKELALAGMKYEKYPYDTSVVITGNEINDYFRVLMAALKEVSPELQEKTIHMSHGMLRLPSGKMSSRTGDVVTAEATIDYLKMEIEANIEKRPDQIDFEQIALAAIKYTILKQSPGKDIIFDIEKSISFEGDSGPYLQYTAVRTKAVQEKAKMEKLKEEKMRPDTFEIQEVERLLHRFPEIVSRAQKELAPQAITTYLIELASSFNAFYAEEKIIDKEDQISPYKIALTEAVGQVLRNGLYLLGIKVPERM